MGRAVDLIDHIERRIKLRDLHILLSVIRAGSMGKAAEDLGTVQPAISRSIADLEKTFGVKLLDRHRHGIEPTEYGRAALTFSMAVFDSLRQGIRTIEFLVDPSGGEVRVGANYFLASSLVPAIIDRLSRRHPRMVVHVSAMQSEALSHSLKAHICDCLIASNLGSVKDDNLVFDHLYHETYIVAAGVQSEWARRRRLALSDMADECWVLPPRDSAIGSLSLQAFRACGLDYPRATSFMINPEARIALLRTGRFLTIVPASALRFPAKRRQIKILPIELSLPRIPIGIVTLKHRALGPAAQRFIELAREIVKPLVEEA